jgi:hypothetical protein
VRSYAATTKIPSPRSFLWLVDGSGGRLKAANKVLGAKSLRSLSMLMAQALKRERKIKVLFRTFHPSAPISPFSAYRWRHWTILPPAAQWGGAHGSAPSAALTVQMDPGGSTADLTPFSGICPARKLGKHRDNIHRRQQPGAQQPITAMSQLAPSSTLPKWVLDLQSPPPAKSKAGSIPDPPGFQSSSGSKVFPAPSPWH